MKDHYFPALILFIGLLIISCGGGPTGEQSPEQRDFDEARILPLYEKKDGWIPGPKHGDALVGSLKYGPGFTHFDYVNPDAPVGGTLTLASQTKFDSFNPFILKGTPAPGIGYLFETLMTSSFDEPASQYGLLAESIEYPEDKSSVTFTLNPRARWHDGKPVTTEDVLFSFEALTTKGSPTYAQYYGDVVRAEKTGPRSVTFFFKKGSNPELPHILGQLAVIPKHFFTRRDFTQPLREPPVGSGPYRIKEFAMGRRIIYVRDQRYWGWDLPVNRGQYNFQNIKYIIYLDREVLFQGFKAGEFDFHEENTASRWAKEYIGPQFENGDIIKTTIPDDTPKGLQGMFFNTRRDMFKDRRIREALTFVFDFEWMNKVLFHGTYKRTRSFFENSVFASYLNGLPSEDELGLLLPFKDQLPEEVFTKAYQPTETDGSGNIRTNLKKAAELLKRAGWTVSDGKLVNADGTQMRIEILLYDQAFERIVAPFIENLKKLGIDATFRIIDLSQWVQRVEQFDFDLINYPIGQSFSPGNEQRYFWGSQAADTPGSYNFAGIKNPVVDSLIENIISAHDFEELKAASRALDRVLLWNHYVIPEWHINYHRIAYRKKLKRLETDAPMLVSIYSPVTLATWWVDPASAVD